MKKIGSLWIKNSKKGQKYMEGTIKLIDGHDIRILLFPNTTKRDNNDVDFNIVLPTIKNNKNNNDTILKVVDEDIF